MVVVMIWIPGVEREDIDFNVTKDAMEITAHGHEMEYHEFIDLPCVEGKEEKEGKWYYYRLAIFSRYIFFCRRKCYGY